MNVLKSLAEFTPVAGFILLILLILFNSFKLKKNGVRISAAENKKSARVKWIYPFYVIFIMFFVAEITRPLNSFSLLPEVLTNRLFDSVLIISTGVLVVILSVYVLKTTLQDFGTSLRFGLNKDNIGRLVTSGIFAKSRNPFFLAFLLFFIGTTLVYPNIFFLAFTLAAFSGIHFSILKEEKLLLKVYGDEYLTYQQKVRRYL